MGGYEFNGIQQTLKLSYSNPLPSLRPGISKVNDGWWERWRGGKARRRGRRSSSELRLDPVQCVVAGIDVEVNQAVR
jgi:hypothetical protein